MSRSHKYIDDCTELDGRELFEPHACDSSLPSAVQALENEELRVLLVALLSEWRTRTARGFHA